MEEAAQTSSPAARSDTPPKSQPPDPLQANLFERKEESVTERTEKTEDKESRSETTPPAKISNRGEGNMSDKFCKFPLIMMGLGLF